MRHATPGGALLHPLALASVALLAVNDHVLKKICPGALSGKLSDFAGIILLPLFLQAASELAFARYRGRAPSARFCNRALIAAICATVTGFALVELWSPADTAYRFGLGVLQWPFQALLELFTEGRLPALRPVRATMDPSDLMALSVAPLAYWVGRRGAARDLEAVAPVLGFALVCALPERALAQSPDHDRPGEPDAGAYRHDGFFLHFELGAAAFLADSSSSFSNGFEQEIPSSASGAAFPAGALELGGTLPGTGLALGGRLYSARVETPVIETLGERFTVGVLDLSVLELSCVVEYYPDPTSGLHFGATLGWMGLDADGPNGGEMHRGPSASLQVGHAFWFGRQWSLGAVARVHGAILEGEEHGRTMLLLPGLYAALSYH